MGLRFAKALVGVDDETAPGYAYVTPAAGDTFAAYDITVNPSGDNYLRKESKPHFGRLPEVAGLGEVEIGFKIPFVGGSGLGVAPYWSKAAEGCGLREEKTVGTNVLYKPWSTFDNALVTPGPPITQNPFQSYSVSVWVDGVKFSIKGGMGNLVFNCKAGDPIEMAFTFKGAYQGVVDEAAPSVTLTALAPPVFLNAALTLPGPYSAIFESLSLDLGNEFGKVLNANDASGLRGYTIINRRILGKINPEMVLVATHDFYGKWRAATQGAIGFTALGVTAGNKIALTIPAAQYHAPGVGNREGQLALDMEFAVVTTGAEGSDFTITLT
jgi:hypothetical protein